MTDEEIDYVECTNCESPCYVFDIDGKGNISSATCPGCGNDEPTEFKIPETGSKPDTK